MNIKPKDKSKDKTKRRVPKKISESYLHNSGLYYLQRFSASSGQFRNVMMRKVKRSCLHHKDQDLAACTTLVEDLVVKFERSGLLNDEIYTGGSVNSLRRQGKSKKAIEAKLTQKGINSQLIELKLRDYDENSGSNPSETELKAALMLTKKKKLGKFRVNPDQKPEKELATLARAGFSYEIARKALNYHEDD